MTALKVLVQLFDRPGTTERHVDALVNLKLVFGRIRLVVVYPPLILRQRAQ
jgi:hypothetical protein